MCQWFTGKTFINADSMRCVVVPALQEVFILARARAQRDEECACLQNARRRLLDQIVAFLGHQPRNHRNDGAIGFSGKTAQAHVASKPFYDPAGERLRS